MNERQRKKFEERYGEKKFVCVDGDEATYEWKDKYEVYSAACQDEAEAVKGLVGALESIANGSVRVEPASFGRDTAMEIIAADALKAYKGE